MRAHSLLSGIDSAALEHYFRLVAPEDVIDRTPEELAAVVSAHIELGQVRPPGQPQVAVHQGAFLLVSVVTDDMPFLVDSLTAEIVRLGHQIRLIVHPQFAAQRDPSGQLQGLSSHGNGIAESWMSFELARNADAASPEDTCAALERVLADVRHAVSDWSAMREKAALVAAEVAATDLAGSAEASDLLAWLADDHFTFLGYREYELVDSDGAVLRSLPGTGLGILRQAEATITALDPDAAKAARERVALVLTKANRRSTVHRPAYLDYVGIKQLDSSGQLVGEKRFLGLYTSSAYTQSIWSIPVLAAKADRILSALGLSKSSHSGKNLIQFLETYPRDELFHVEIDELIPVAQAVLHLQERRQTRCFLRRDRYGRFVSALVYLPRDRYTTDVRLEMERILKDAFDSDTVDTTAHVSESVLARLHFVVRVPSGTHLPQVDEHELEQRLGEATRSWADDLSDELVDTHGEDVANRILRTWTQAFPASYTSEFTAHTAVAHIARFDRLAAGDLDVELYESRESGVDRRFAIFRKGSAMSLSELLPVLQNLGVEVVDERPYTLTPSAPDMPECHIYDFGLRFAVDSVPAKDTLPLRVAETFMSEWRRQTANHHMNALVTWAGLTVRQATILRAYSRYLRQSRLMYSLGYIENTLIGHSDVTQLLVAFFEAKFDPSVDSREQAIDSARTRIHQALEAVPTLDADRILRSFVTLINNTLRTNCYQRSEGALRPYLSFKIAAENLGDLLAAPRPKFEVWVYSPEVEGVHLRFGAVARGGLRWSDRPDDFRTEILGLVKAQMVKNSVIVPVGAKGGFVVQHPLESSDRDAWLAQGIECYQVFIRALLDITDNLDSGVIVPPVDVVRHDGDDPYLVVAADKGTATFSDYANAISVERGFWLGDAFASGGSAGYDHKAMGITARGAWESVKRHFREMGIDTQSQDFTVVGIGDMSGDVFGNGMLLSEHIRLVAAFDHRHIFIDPNPDAATSFRERQRLFGLPRSSWADYDAQLISRGGGVFSRSQKSIALAAEARHVLGIADDVEALSPNDVMQAILKAPVDLLWNGGIGTYVKASTQSHADVGDKSNDAIRVDGRELRARVVGEGGNLGLTQMGRVEAALAGVRINTDAIDNSAGVDTSDHEVNIKILLEDLIRRGVLDRAGRDALLMSMTDDVAGLVLRDNYEQNVVLANARRQAPSLIPVHRRMINEWESSGLINRKVEFLPDDVELATREAAGLGLTSPELAVVLAYSKITLADDLLAAGLADDPAFGPVLISYFPSQVQQLAGEHLQAHPLRRDIITTGVVNRMINYGGISFVFRAKEETGATASDVARAFVITRAVFDLPAINSRIEALDGIVATDVQGELYLEVRRLLDRSVRWFLSSGAALDVAAQINSLRPLVAHIAPRVPALLIAEEHDRWTARAQEFIDRGVPADLARDVAALLDVFSLLDVATVVASTQADVEETAALYFALSARFDVDRLLLRISALPREDRWEALARGSLRSDLYGALRALCSAVLRSTSAASDRIQQWERANLTVLQRAEATLAQMREVETWDLATISVALRTLRSLVP